MARHLHLQKHCLKMSSFEIPSAFPSVFLKFVLEFWDFSLYLSWPDLKASIFSILVLLSSGFQLFSVSLLIVVVAWTVVGSLSSQFRLFSQLTSPFSGINKV